MAFADFTTAKLYTAIITALNTQLTAVAGLFKDQTTGDFVGQKRHSTTGKRLEEWSGSVWVPVDLSSTTIAAASIAAGTITATLAGNSTSSTNATDHIADVTGAVHGATSAKTANMICRRDAAGAIAADVTGNVSGSSGSCTGQSATVATIQVATNTSFGGLKFKRTGTTLALSSSANL